MWGRDWIHAKTQAECYDYLFEAAVRMSQMGIDYRRPPPPLFADVVTTHGANGVNGHAEANGAPAAKRAKTKRE